nr:hypothetical protein BdHM001_08830 [Bdellovibrio sp. HM001]
MVRWRYFLLTSILAFTSSSGAETYHSFIYRDSSLYNRADIVEVFPKLPLEVSRQHNDSVSLVTLADVDLYFFNELTELLNTVNNPSNTRWRPLPATNLCESHKGLKTEHLQKIKNHCVFPRVTFAKVFSAENLRASCEEAYQPELYVNDLGPGEIHYSKMDEISGLAQAIAAPLRYVDFAANLVTPELLEKMRLMLSKVRMTELLDKVQKQKKDYQQILSLLDSKNCLTLSPQERAELAKTLETLQQEIQQAEAHLIDIDQKGRQQAEADRQAITKQGLHRPRLPYPNLSDADREFITMYISSIMWRFRGGGIVEKSDSTQMRRIFYTWAPVKALGKLNGGNDGDQLGRQIFMGLMKGWGEYFDMGTWPAGKDKYYDFTKMTERGIFQVKRAAATLQNKGYDVTPLKMAGLQMGPCYYYSYDQNLPRLKYVGRKDSGFLAFVEGGTDWGEVCFGAALGLGISKTLLQGSKK